jgi:general secretion pathway protein M
VRLSGREKLVVIVGTALVACLLFWVMIWEPVQDHLATLNRRIQAKKVELRQIQELAARYQRLKVADAELQGRLQGARGFSTLSYLEKLALEHDIRNKITQMRARGTETGRYFKENPIEIKMEKISLPELVKYLYELENPKQRDNVTAVLRVKQLRVHQRFENKSLLDVTLQVSTYESLEKI